MSSPAFPLPLIEWISLQNDVFNISKDTVQDVLAKLTSSSQNPTISAKCVYNAITTRPKQLLIYFQLAKDIHNSILDELLSNEYHQVQVNAGFKRGYFKYDWPNKPYSPLMQALVQDDVSKLSVYATQPTFNANEIVELPDFGFVRVPNKLPLLHFSAIMGSIKCFKFLMLNGGDMKKVSDSTEDLFPTKVGRTCLYFGVASGNHEITQLCYEQQLPIVDALFSSIDFFRQDVLQWIFENELCDPNVIDENLTPLIDGILRDNIESVQFLLERGAGINIEDTNHYRPIFEACMRENCDLIRYFVSNGASLINKFQERTPLEYSIDHMKLDSIKTLCEVGIQLSSQNQDKIGVLLEIAQERRDDPLVERIKTLMNELNIQPRQKRK